MREYFIYKKYIDELLKNQNNTNIPLLQDIYSYKDYFMALVSPSTLRGLKMHIDQTTHYSIREDNKVVFENLKEDDNLVLVFFKIKDLWKSAWSI